MGDLGTQRGREETGGIKEGKILDHLFKSKVPKFFHMPPI